MVLSERSAVVLGCLSLDNLSPSQGREVAPSALVSLPAHTPYTGASDFHRLSCLEKRETWPLGPVCPCLPQDVGFLSPKTNVALGDMSVVECHETL